MKKLVIAISLFAMSGCASLTPTREVVEGYKIYDIKTEYNAATTTKLAGELKKAMQLNAKDVQFSNGLPPSPLPEKPQRFQLTNPFKGATGFMAMAAASNEVVIPSCEGAVIQATSKDDFAGAENTVFFVCLMPYQQGYHMNVYHRFTKVSGGVGAAALSRAIVSSAAGDSSQFIPRTVLALETAVKNAGAIPTVVETYPN